MILAAARQPRFRDVEPSAARAVEEKVDRQVSPSRAEGSGEDEVPGLPLGAASSPLHRDHQLFHSVMGVDRLGHIASVK